MITIKDISKICEVSVTAVSLVLNDKPNRISKEKVNLIKKTAKELGYQPNSIARAMVTNRTGILALLVPDISNPFFSQVAQRINYHAMKKGYSMFLGETSNDSTTALKLLNTMISFKIDGLILTKSSRLSSEEEGLIIKKLESNNILIISIDSNIESGTHCSVLVDHEYGGYLATKHLIRAGHKKIIAFTGPKMSITSEQRLSGYKKALKEYDIKFDESMLIEGSYSIDSSCLKAINLAKDKNATSIFCFNDMMAVGVINECTKMNMNLPRDLSIIGFDDTYLADIVYPKLTSLSQPIEKMSSLTIETIDSMINKTYSEKSNISLKPKLVERESVYRIE